MRILYFFGLVSTILFTTACGSSKMQTEKAGNWHSAAKTEDMEIFVDVSSIKRVGTLLVAREKKVFYSPQSKAEYVSKIRAKYASLGKPDKINKWADFSYTIYESEYDCINHRQRVLGVEDYDSQGIRIIKTPSDKKEDKWKDVDPDTIGDYTFFYVCDYED